MGRCNEENVNDVMSFILNTPCEEEIIAMDCNDYCDRISRLAELVAEGASLEQIRPALEEHMEHWKDCREEFDALVAILTAESDGKLNNPEIEALLKEIEESEPKNK